MVAHFAVKKIKPEDLHLDILPRLTRRAFLYCQGLDFLTQLPWYLAGGTGLALQAGHRQSIDLDFFTQKSKFPETLLERRLLATGEWSTTFREEGTIYGAFLGAKMSFIAYPFFKPSPQRIACGEIHILEPSDIAAMKIMAVSQRGRKRDFIDLYWYCQNKEPLDILLRHSLKQYPGQEDNLPHILKSLVYFKDAENDPMPKVFFKVNWPSVKKYFQREVLRIYPLDNN